MSGAAGPADDWRPLVVATVASVLGRDPSDVTAAPSLFALPGFDSVAVVTLLERLEDAGGVEVQAHRILPEAFDTPDTVAALLAGADPIGPTSTPVPGGTA